MSDESEELVAKYVEEMGISLRMSAGFSGGKEWGVAGYPSAVLINPEGQVTWTGDPRSLSKGPVKEALKGAKGGSGGYLSFAVADELNSKLKSAVKSAADGKLSKAHADALALALDETQDAAVRAEAQSFADQVQAYATLLRDQAEAKVKQLNVLEGVEIFESLKGAVKGMELEGEITKRLAEISKDEKLQMELEAAQALDKAIEAAAKRGMKKSLSKFEAVIKKYPDSAAAKRAQKRMSAE